MIKFYISIRITIILILISGFLADDNLENNNEIEIKNQIENENITIILDCYCCDSSETIDCENNIENLKNSNICKCTNECAVSYVNGTIVRDCLMKFIQQPFENITETCDRHLCNSNLIEINLNSVENLNINNKLRYNVNMIDTENNLNKELIISNNFNFEEKPIISCLKCNSSENDQCLKNPMNIQSVTECSSDCFTAKIDNNLIRGCGSDLNETQQEQCNNEESCQLCNTENCNDKNWRFCYSCNSMTNPNCAQWYSQENINIEICSNYYDNCLIEINSLDHTIRKCIPRNYECEHEIHGLCQRCLDKNLCNNNIFPKNRIQCHQCYGTQKCALLQLDENMKPCVKYLEKDSCFYYHDGQMKRGCKSDIENFEKCKESPDTCRTCDNLNGCNNLALYQSPKLSCSICDKSFECAWYQPNNTIKKCRHEFLYYLNETCVTYFMDDDDDDDNDEAERDCTFDKGDCDEGKNCFKCSEIGCNVKNIIKQSCYQCDSSIKEQIECANTVQGLKSELCSAEIQYYSRRGCYVLRKSDNSVKRGCAYDLSAKDFELCQNEHNNTCSYCPGMNCNNKKPNGADNISISNQLFTFIIFKILLIILN